jgi:hypothetical protein
MIGENPIQRMSDSALKRLIEYPASSLRGEPGDVDLEFEYPNHRGTETLAFGRTQHPGCWLPSVSGSSCPWHLRYPIQPMHARFHAAGGENRCRDCRGIGKTLYSVYALQIKNGHFLSCGRFSYFSSSSFSDSK